MSTIKISFQKKSTYIKKVNFCSLVLILFISFLSSCSTTKLKTTTSALISNSAKKSNLILNKIKIKSTDAPMIIFTTHLLQNETYGINSLQNETNNTDNPVDGQDYPDLNNTSPLSTVSAFSLTQIKSKTITSSENLISKQITNTPSAPVTTNPPQTTQQSQGSSTIKTVEPLSDPSDPYAFASTKVKCAVNNCPLPNLCVADFICKCSKESANYLSKAEIEKNSSNLDMKYCLYTRKKQIVSFLLEFFIMPVGHFYSGNYFIACLKILFPIFIIILLFMKGDTNKLIGSILGCMLSVWWLIDAILYGTNTYKDQNGVKLELW